MSNKKIERRIIIDEPCSEDQFHGKGHERIANALAKAIAIFDKEDRAIGVDGPWGSGKSSVVEIAEKKLSKEVEGRKSKFHFFTYDIWKSQGSSFRRSFLERFLEWVKTEFPNKSEKLRDIENKVRGKTKEIHTNNQAVLDWYGIAVLVTLPFLPIYYFWAKSVFDDLVKVERTIDFLCSPPFIVLLIFVFSTIARATWRFWVARRSNHGASFRLAISQTLLISAKQFEDQTVTQHIRETDPNDFEFQSIFREILSVIQDRNDRVVVVLDNIDRLPSNEINEYWALVRSVFSRGSVEKIDHESRSITAIVPYDRHLIESEENNFEDNDNSPNISSLSRREIFSKTFDEILSVAPPVMSNSRDFFHQKIEKALPNFSTSDELFSAYLIFNKVLEKDGGTATPRQIISFINALTGLYVLHEGLFRLPTVATYIAYQDALEENPVNLTDGAFIDDRLRTLAADNELERNLAAMIFNVEPELAFQLLLDERIKSAASSRDAIDLKLISESPGFDLRINEVVVSNVREWIETDEFGNVIENFSLLAKEYNGDTTQHFSNTLVTAFYDVRTIVLEEEGYTPYIKLISLCDCQALPELTGHLIACVLKGVKGEEDTEGAEWVVFLDQMSHSLVSIGQTGILEKTLNSVQLPSEANFLFGVASNTPSSSIDFNHFQKPTLKIPDGERFLEDMAIQYPDRALRAYLEFKNISLLSDDQWVSIASTLLESLAAIDQEDGDDFSNQLTLLSNVWAYTSSEKRSNINLNSAFGESQFYKNIHSKYLNNIDNLALSHALFLAGEGRVEFPSLGASHQVILNNLSEYAWFNELFEGKISVNSAQHKVIAKQSKLALRVTHWLELGASSPDNKLIISVVRSAFLLQVLPGIKLSTLISNFEYLKNVLDNKFVGMISQFGSRITEKELSSLEINTVPLGLLSDAHEATSEKWVKFHKKIDDLIQDVPEDNWMDHLTAFDHTVEILLEKISTSGLVFDKASFRDTFISFVLDILDGDVSFDQEAIDYNGLIMAIDKDYHEDVIRKIREKLNDVTETSLASATKIFPDLLKSLLTIGSRITKNEKENVVRYLLCPALEGNNDFLLHEFVGMGRNRIADFIKYSEDSTQKKKDGAWKHFAKNCQDKKWRLQIGDLLHGKRQTKKILAKLFGEKEPDDNAMGTRK